MRYLMCTISNNDNNNNNSTTDYVALHPFTYFVNPATGPFRIRTQTEKNKLMINRSMILFELQIWQGWLRQFNGNLRRKESLQLDMRPLLQIRRFQGWCVELPGVYTWRDEKFIPTTMHLKWIYSTSSDLFEQTMRKSCVPGEALTCFSAPEVGGLMWCATGREIYTIQFNSSVTAL